MEKAYIVIVTAIAVFVPRTTWAQCTTDIECKGKRICVAGACENPSPSDGFNDGFNVGPATERSDSPGAGSQKVGWGIVATILGVASAGGVVGLAVLADFAKEDQMVSLPLGMIATLWAAAMVPVVSAGGISSRRTGAQGVLGLRIAGWVVYGLALVNAAALIGLSVADALDDMPHGIVAGVGGLGGASLIAFSLDALFSEKQGRRLASTGGMGVLPNIGLARIGADQVLPTFGIAWQF